jgi:FixJ family two-component response regulator
MSDPATVFIVDDDVAVRDSLGMLLEAAGYAAEAFQCAADFLDNLTPSTRGCLILDVRMPDMDGLDLQKELIRRGARLPVIFLTGHGTIPATVRAIKAGAMDFLTKPVDGPALLAHVEKALKQGSAQQKRIDSYQAAASRLATLTDREREVLTLAVAGHVSKEIAQRLGISSRTVEIHRAHILQKTGASNLLEVARITGLLESGQEPP